MVRWLATGLLATMIGGCSVEPPVGARINPTAQTGPSDTDSDDSHGVSGVWEGMSQARPTAMRFITLTMVQQGNEVTGYYKCAYGNQLCRNMNETGVIRDGRMVGRRLIMRVMLEDGSTCYFTGVPQGDELHGSYVCGHGSGTEVGRFRTERSY